MKDWKEQLNNAKSALFGTTSKKVATEKPRVTDFVPPDSWLKADDGDQKQEKSSLEAAPVPNERRKARGVHQPVLPVPESTKSAMTSASTGKREGPAGITIANGGEQASTKSTPPPPVFRPCADAGLQLSMPEWSDTGRSLQHPEGTGRGVTAVRMGINFGTAFTKVAIRAGMDLILVDWSAVTGDDSPAGRYVLPGFVHRTRQGLYRWGMADGVEIQGNLKLSIIDLARGDDCPFATLAFLALVIRHARAFLYRDPEVGRKLASRSLRWELNIGCPTEPHEKPEVVKLLQRIARTSWRLAAEGDLGEVGIDCAWKDQAQVTGLEAEPGVVPEFVAQIAGYLRSPQVNEGLHALVDIGAATLDVATFNVVLPREAHSIPRVPIFFSAVRPLGTHYLSHDRHFGLGLELAWDDALPVDTAKSFAQRYGKSTAEVQRIDERFVNRTTKAITAVIDGTRTNRRGDPRSAAWREGLPIFVTGGGSGCRIYLRAIECAENLIKRKTGNAKFRLIELAPLGSNHSLFGTSDGGRTTVAIGLTEDAESIARVVPHREIEPITYTSKERTDHSELYGDR